MPRYELIEGKSKKFWEIQLEDASFTTTFGRIGTRGQVKSKDFADASAAQKAYDKLIEEKLKKGYVLVDEVGGARTTTPAGGMADPAPIPVPEPQAEPEAEPQVEPEVEPVAPDDEAPAPNSEERSLGRVVWTDAMDAHLPPPAQVEPPPALEDAATLYARINAWTMPRIKPAIEQGIAAYPRGAALANRLVWSYFAPQPPASLDAEVEAAALLLFTSGPDLPNQDIARTIVHFWVAHSGLVFALEAWTKTLAPVDVVLYGWGRDGFTPRLTLVPLHPADAPLAPGQRIRRNGASAVLRGLLEAATPDERARVRERASALRDAGDAVTRFGLDEVLGDAEWLREDVAILRQAGSSIFMYAPRFIMRSLPPEELAAVFDDLTYEEWRSLSDELGELLSLVQRHGARGLLPLAAWIRRTAQLIEENPYAAEHLGSRAEVLLRLLLESVEDSPPIAEAACALVTQLGKVKLSKDSDPTPTALALIRAMPNAALPVVERAAKRNAGWAKALLPQLERLTGRVERAPEASIGALPEALKGGSFKRAPEFWSPELLPQILLHDGGALPSASVDALGQALVQDDAAVIETAKAACTPTSLARFAWELFVVWDGANGPTKHKWAMSALGHFGDDDCARDLTAYIRRWPGESQHKRAVHGLEVLSAIGTDTAMMCLNGIAQKVKFKALQKHARAKMDEIAERRGMSKEELEDRLIPDLDLEDDGSMELDFGPRSFRVGFDEALKPFVVDAAGKRRASLPKPSKSDDPALAAEATARFAGMKKDVRALAKIELARLEQAMGRREWPIADFEAFLVHHPLMIHLVRRLLWGVVDEGGRPTQRFRVAEDRTYADVDDDVIELAEDAVIGLVHRLHLSDDEASRWQRVFADYELSPPFPQLDRDVYRLAPGDAEEHAIVRFVGREVETKAVRGLASRGWHHGTPLDGGVYHCFGKPIGGGLHAWLSFESGISVDGYDYEPTQRLGKIELGPDEPWGWGQAPNAGFVPLSTVDEVTISEVLRDVESLPALAPK